jgi:hypothetical protein
MKRRKRKIAIKSALKKQHDDDSNRKFYNAKKKRNVET